MKNTFVKLALTGALLFSSINVHAITVAVSPNTSSVVLGSSLDVQVLISNLGDGISPSISAYDIDIAYDDSILSFNSVTFGDSSFGNQLDIWGFNSNLTGLDDTTSGVVNVAEASFDSQADLDSFQRDSFALFTVNFDAIGLGNSGLNLTINDLTGSNYNTLAAITSNGSASVTPVPLPAALPLMLSALAAIGFVRGRKTARA